MNRLIAAVTLAAGAACGPNAPILMYHSVGELNDAFTVREIDFTAQLDFLREAGFQTVTLHELLEHEERKAPLPDHPVVLTFDDGYQDAVTRVLPALRARGQRATFFIITRFCGRDEAHRRVENAGTPREKRYLLWDEVRALRAAGMEIGSHSLSHRRLTALPLDEVERELSQSRSELEGQLRQPVELFAYPYNSERRELRRMVERAGYRAAVSGAHGLGDRFELARTGVFRGMTAADLRNQLGDGWASGYTSDGK